MAARKRSVAQRRQDFATLADHLVDAVRAVEIDTQDMRSMGLAMLQLDEHAGLPPGTKRGYLAVLRRIQQRIDRLQKAVDAARTDAQGR